MSDKTAVLLLQMGGPDSLDAVEPFLRSLFSGDREGAIVGLVSGVLALAISVILR